MKNKTDEINGDFVTSSCQSPYSYIAPLFIRTFWQNLAKKQYKTKQGTMQANEPSPDKQTEKAPYRGTGTFARERSILFSQKEAFPYARFWRGVHVYRVEMIVLFLFFRSRRSDGSAGPDPEKEKNRRFFAAKSKSFTMDKV